MANTSFRRNCDWLRDIYDRYRELLQRFNLTRRRSTQFVPTSNGWLRLSANMPGERSLLARSPFVG